MEKQEVTSAWERVENFFDSGEYEAAIDLLQECINTSRVESKEFMESLRDSTKDAETLDKLQYMYFLNFV
ncbi:MAG: hypothetical protein P1Q69_13745 [Candidatus Thorarchaeota archaeon]|nr:hypothetical protein [Candidatus Thorarchaeota archaeon]